jgi:tRNA-splicing ligase RtcB
MHEIEKDALAQLKVLAESPLPTDYVAAMPDAHLGKGVTIGTVFASENYVCPNAVGVDIGCGVAAIPIEGLFKWMIKPNELVRIQQLIKERIPTGFNQHRKTLDGTRNVIDNITGNVKPSQFLAEQLTLPRVTDQLGTLGGGNHFLELVCEENSGQVWVMLHSGSRNIGNRVATHYDRVAKHLLESKGVDAKALKGINYMPIESIEGQDYLRDMEWSQQYAFHNRRMMKEILLDIIGQVTGNDADLSNSVNIHHNYCQCEDCGGDRKLWVTRKGATSAKLGEMGIIPGSMGTGSYITRGKGNRLSWNSASHGAGRKMSRTRAHSSIPQEAFEESMKGILCDTHPSVKDEAPQAYKDPAEVMKNQESLTEIVYHLRPILNVKGFEKKLPHKYRKATEKKK